MKFEYVLWDFGDTLVDQDWMLRAPAGYPEWSRAWTEVARGDSETDWYVNRTKCADIAERVSKLLGMSLEATLQHIRDCCCNVCFFDAPFSAARTSSLRQAIVTVNPDIFSTYVVPEYRLDELFPIIVTSWEERTVDKAELCAQAVRRMGAEIEFQKVLLIDNSEEAVRGWQKAGGQGYVFRGEEGFTADLDTCLLDLKQSLIK